MWQIIEGTFALRVLPFLFVDFRLVLIVAQGVTSSDWAAKTGRASLQQGWGRCEFRLFRSISVVVYSAADFFDDAR
jgi:hypothetical protein